MSRHRNVVERAPFAAAVGHWLQLTAQTAGCTAVGVVPDKATAFAALARITQLATAPVTLVLIARTLTPPTQGYYFTFASLAGLTTFFELGFYIVIINNASHEWAQLSLDGRGVAIGSEVSLSRLASLARLTLKWYAVASLLFMAVAGPAGMIFLSQPRGAPPDEWRLPWISLVTLTGVLLWVLPLNSMLEGCNQVAPVNRLRFEQVALSAIGTWGGLLAGAQLWAIPIAAAAKLAANANLLLHRYRGFFLQLVRTRMAHQVSWKHEIWPMQWRLAASGLVNYFVFWLFTPIMFHYHGPVVAGQMGMTWQFINGIQALAMAWISTKVPQFGMLIAERKYQELDVYWARSSVASLVVFLGAAAAVECGVSALYFWSIPFHERLLPPLPTGVLLLGAVLMQASQCLTAYMRAHKEEPIVKMSVVTSVLVGGCVWGLGAALGPTGAAFGYLAPLAVALAWEFAIWSRCRREWHAERGL